MRSITKWVADDGSEFDTQEACKIYENRESLISDLSELIDGSFCSSPSPSQARQMAEELVEYKTQINEIFDKHQNL